MVCGGEDAVGAMDGSSPGTYEEEREDEGGCGMRW